MTARKLLCPALLLAFAFAAHAADSFSLHDALARRGLRCELTSPALDQLRFTVVNSSSGPLRIAIPTGAIATGPEGTGSQIILRGAELAVESGGTGEAVFPAALLSAKPAAAGPSRHFVEDLEKRLDPLLKRLAGEKDLPRATAQLAVFCLLEDITFAGWQKFLGTQRGPAPDPDPHPTPAEVAQALDALGLVQEVAPGREFALAKDGELKLRALRNPWCRAKAMQLFGIKATDDGSEFGLPNLSQLLHTKPGDNCPVCRSRAEMQKGAGDF